jgi:AcrR family transcriptional regulator
MEAGLELFGTDGYANTSIRAVSAAASLNSRYFYESFGTREDLLYHVYMRIIGDIASSVVAETEHTETLEEQARAGLRAAWTILTEDARKARVIALEVVGVSERLQRARRENVHMFADLVVQNTQAVTGGASGLRMDPVLTARSLMGAITDMLEDWINGDVTASGSELVEHFTQLFITVYAPGAPAGTLR